MEKLYEYMEKLNIEKDSQKKVEQIDIVLKSLPLHKSLELISKQLIGEQLSNTVYGAGDEAYIKYETKKTTLKNANKTESLSLKVEDKSFLNVGLLYYTVETFKIENLNQKELSVYHSNHTVSFDKADTLYENEIKFKFNKKNELEEIYVEKTNTSNYKTTSKVQSYSKDQVKKMMAQAKSNNTDKDMLF